MRKPPAPTPATPAATPAATPLASPPAPGPTSVLTLPSAALIRDLLIYDDWATQAHARALIAITALGKVPPEDARRPFVHLIAAREAWLNRVHGRPNPGWQPTPDWTVEVAADHAATVAALWTAWAKAISDADLGRTFSFHDSKGILRRDVLGPAVLHLINHGSYHRGQVAAALRSHGHTPPATDMILFYRPPTT